MPSMTRTWTSSCGKIKILLLIYWMSQQQTQHQPSPLTTEKKHQEALLLPIKKEKLKFSIDFLMRKSLLWEQTSQGSFVACLVHQMIPSWHCGCSNTQRFIHHQVLGTGKQKRGVRRNFTNCVSLLLGLLPAGRKYNRLIKFH